MLIQTITTDESASLDQVAYDLMWSPLGQFTVQVTVDPQKATILDLTPRQESILMAFCQSEQPSGFLSTGQLAAAIHVTPVSVGKLVERLNGAVRRQMGDTWCVIVSQRRRGYRLNVNAVRRAP